MAEVSKGALNAQHMKDISALLNDHVGGNHLRGMESDNCSCDTAEWRYILSDWYNQKMFYYDSKTAVNMLVEVFIHPSVNLPRIASCMTKFINHVTRIVLLGESGCGKSSVGNSLLGLDPESFKTSTGTKSCTIQTKEIIGTWLSNGNLCAIVYTPGMNDSDNRDTEHMRNIVNFLKETSFVNCFLLLRNGSNPRIPSKECSPLLS